MNPAGTNNVSIPHFRVPTIEISLLINRCEDAYPCIQGTFLHGCTDEYKRNCIQGEWDMGKKVVDMITYKIEKSLKNSGYTVKKDREKNVTLLIKLNQK